LIDSASGTIDVQEFHGLFNEVSSPFLLHLFRKMDVNSDGTLSFIEFVHVRAVLNECAALSKEAMLRTLVKPIISTMRCVLAV